MTPKPKLSIVIPTFNRKDSILHVLTSLTEQDAGGIDCSIIVVVDGSTDGTQQAIRTRFPDVILVEGTGHWWWTKSVNEGCRKAVENHSDAVLLLNDDIDLDDHFLRALIQAHHREPQAVIGSLNVTHEPEKKIFFSGSAAMGWWNGTLERYHPFLSPYDGTLTGLHPTIVAPGRGLLIPVSVFETIGYFDEKGLPQYKADYDFVLRAHKRGIPCRVSWDAVVWVHVETSGKGATFTKGSLASFIRSLFQTHSRVNVYRNWIYYKRHYPWRAFPFLPFAACRILIRQLHAFLNQKKY
ncbi:MAG: glycosyltransferase family 2 protein [Candidatus Omnitrophota bacterium]